MVHQRVHTFIHAACSRDRGGVLGPREITPLRQAPWRGCEVCFVFGLALACARASCCGKMINCCGSYSLCASRAVWISPFSVALWQRVFLSHCQPSRQSAFSAALLNRRSTPAFYRESSHMMDSGRFCQSNCGC